MTDHILFIATGKSLQMFPQVKHHATYREDMPPLTFGETALSVDFQDALGISH